MREKLQQMHVGGAVVLEHQNEASFRSMVSQIGVSCGRVHTVRKISPGLYEVTRIDETAAQPAARGRARKRSAIAFHDLAPRAHIFVPNGEGVDIGRIRRMVHAFAQRHRPLRFSVFQTEAHGICIKRLQ